MAITKSILGKINRLKVSKYPPKDKYCVWAMPLGGTNFSFYVYNNGSWRTLNVTGGMSGNEFTNYYKGSVDSLLITTANLAQNKLEFKFVDALPETVGSADKCVLYLMPSETEGQVKAYIYSEAAKDFVQIGI